MADYDRAAAYVLAHGTPLDVARMCRLVGRDPSVSVEQTVAELAEQAGPQGGFAAPWSADGESVDATCTRLDQLSDLGPAAAGVVDHALVFLAGRQGMDGAVVEPELPGLLAPEWADPASPRAVLYLTAHAGYWLARSSQHERTARAAARYVGDRLDAVVDPESYVPSMWLGAALLGSVGEDDAARQLTEALAALVEELGPESLAWLAQTLPNSSVASAARFRLRWRQEPDGRWASEQGPENDAALTVAAIRALLAGDRLDESTV